MMNYFLSVESLMNWALLSFEILIVRILHVHCYFIMVTKEDLNVTNTIDKLKIGSSFKKISLIFLNPVCQLESLQNSFRSQFIRKFNFITKNKINNNLTSITGFIFSSFLFFVVISHERSNMSQFMRCFPQVLIYSYHSYLNWW